MRVARSIAAKFMKFGIGKKGAPMLKQLNRSAPNVELAQKAVLNDILRYAGNTEYGRTHHFDRVQTASDWSSAVPVNDYESLRPFVERHEKGESDVLFPGKPMFYATTSGTTAAPKRIPITRKYHDECYNGLTNLWLHSMFQETPDFMDGYDISMVGKAIEGYTADGTSYGSFSGHMNAYMPEFIKRFRVIPFEVHDIDDYAAKYNALLRVGLSYPISWIVAANPSTLLELHRFTVRHLDTIIRDIHDGTLQPDLAIPAPIREKIKARLKPDKNRATQLTTLADKYGDALRPKHYWPSLKMINTWKSGNAAVYLSQTSDYYPESTVIREFGYLATEARAGIVLNNNQETSILAAHLLYFEFIDQSEMSSPSPKILGAHELEMGREYAILITTSGGLYRYNMNDVVRVEDFYGTFPMVRFVQKGSGVTSLTGEKLYESQYLEAITSAAALLNFQTAFHMAFADISDSRYHCFIEPAQPGVANDQLIPRLADEIDKTLQSINPEYASKRQSNRLQPLLVHTLRANAFEEYKHSKLLQGQREAQFKLTHLQQDSEHLRLFHSLCTPHSDNTGGYV